MIQQYSAAPPVGVVPGDLRVDSGSRTLWLGVETAVDPDGAILISDIVALEAEIADVEARANTYTDTVIETRALVDHTHDSSEITDFDTAVEAIATSLPQLNWVPGMIMLWSGSLVEIGTGPLVGWHICDGSNGTPDLRSRFVLGAGNIAVGVVNPGSSAATSQNGAHSHTGVTGNTTLTVAQLASHTHGDGSLVGAANGNTGQGGSHSHGAGNGDPFVTFAGGAGGQGTSGGGYTTTAQTDIEAAHTHPISNVAVSITGNTAAAGSGAAHSHPIAAEAAHVHTITSGDLRDAMPYYALAYIMKLP